MHLWAVSHLAAYQPDYHSVFYAIFRVYTNHKKEPDSFESFLKSINKPSLDSNDFKKEELYQNFKESTYMSELWQYILSLKKLPKK